MAVKFTIKAKGLDMLKNASKAVFEAVKDAMDDIKDDVVEVSSSLAPHKTGRLEQSHFTRRSYVNLQKCTFSIRYKAENPKDGYDYSGAMHDSSYNLGEGSRAKQPAHSRFARGSLHVGRGYLSQVIEASEEQWDEYIAYTVERKLKQALQRDSKK